MGVAVGVPAGWALLGDVGLVAGERPLPDRGSGGFVPFPEAAAAASAAAAAAIAPGDVPGPLLGCDCSFPGSPCAPRMPSAPAGPDNTARPDGDEDAGCRCDSRCTWAPRAPWSPGAALPCGPAWCDGSGGASPLPYLYGRLPYGRARLQSRLMFTTGSWTDAPQQAGIVLASTPAPGTSIDPWVTNPSVSVAK